MSYYPRSSSSYQRTNNNFYITSLHPSSFYSPKNNSICKANIRTYVMNDSPKSPNKDSYNTIEKSINIFRSNINRAKPSPFYNNEKSLRLQDEIDWINKIVSNKTKINKLVESNNKNNNINNEEKEMDTLLRSKIRSEELNNINNDINNKLKYKKFNYIDYYLNNRENLYPLNININSKNKRLFSKNEYDNYNHKIFMNEMINFKNDGIKRWKNEFNNKFDKY